MTWEILALALFLGAAGGVLVPAAALLKHQQFAQRIARLPAATALENVEEQLVERRRDMDALQVQLTDLAEQLVRRDMAVAEAEEARAKRASLEESIALMDAKRLELEQLEQSLVSRHEAMADLTQRLAEGEARVDEQDRLLRRVHSELLAAEDQAKMAQDRREQIEQAVEDLGIRQREVEATLQETKLDLQLTEKALESQRARIADGDEMLRHQSKDLDDVRATRDNLNAEVIMLEQRKAELERTKATLHGYIERAQAELDEEKDNALADLKRVPSCLNEAGFNAERGWLAEEEALDGLRSYLNDLGMRFPQRTLNAFHTCLKINSLSPLTVLAGISGTGKSELPRRYAEGMGIHFFQMAVQPRWDSPQDLFGFYNYLERRYIGTDLARALVHLDDYNHPDLAEPWRDRMLLVLLDEMNLARVEYYFSEFLSRLEVRKSVVATNPASRQNAELHLDVGGHERLFKIYVDRNVLFVGTMNEDESTQTLSDKVIDRANVLRFGRPKTMADEQPRQDITRHDRYLSREVWSSWERAPDTLDHQSRDRLRTWISQLNDAMDALERPFGHRVNQAIQMYCSNYPGAGPQSLSHAFSDQLEQRILPKLRGIDTIEYSTPLGQIEDLIAKIGDDPLAEAVHSGRQKPLFGWQGLNRDN